MNTALNRTSVALLTNKSGGSVAQGDVVIVDATTAASFTTTTTSAYASGSVGVVLEPNGIASNAVGTVAFGGYVPIVNLSGSASLGDIFKTHSVAKQAVRHAGPIVAGDFGQVLGTGTTPAAFLFNQPSAAASGGSTTLAGDTDASITSPAAGQSLVYDGAHWINQAGAAYRFFDITEVGSVASITVSSIPAGYSRMEIFIDSRGDNASNNVNINLTFNSDTGANYDGVDSYAQGGSSTFNVGNNAAQTSMFIGWASGASAPANESSQIRATVNNYAGTTFQKGLLAAVNIKQGTTSGGFFVGQVAGWWRNTGAITSFTLTPSAGNFIAGTRVTVYLYP